MNLLRQNNLAPTADTPAAWKTLLGTATGWSEIYYSQSGKFTNQPTQYGLLRTLIRGNDVLQEWIGIPNGRVLTRGGNATGWRASSTDTGEFKELILDKATKSQIDWDSMLEVLGTSSSTHDVGTSNGSSYTFTSTCIFMMIIQWSGSANNYAWSIRDTNNAVRYQGTWLNNQPNWNFMSPPMMAKKGWKIRCEGQNSTNFCRVQVMPLNP